MAAGMDAERLVCAVLAAQAAQLRDRIDTTAAVDLMWRSADTVSALSDLVTALSARLAVPDADLERHSRHALAAAQEMRGALGEMAFVEAQRQDFARQMADCLQVALGRLAAPAAQEGPRLTPPELAALYVSEDQRRVHEAVVSHGGRAAPGGAPVIAADATPQPGPGQGRLPGTLS